MKHSVKITILLISMFFITQLIGIAVVNQYTPITTQFVDEEGNIKNHTTYNLPYGTDPPEETDPALSLLYFIIALTIAVLLMLLLMRYQIKWFLRIWFLVVVILAIGITLSAFLLNIPYGSLIALGVAIPLALLKIFKRNIIVHNLTELLIYPGIGAILVSLLSKIWVAVAALIFLSIYDAYAVWHAGFMQKMAQYQIEKLRVFSGFFVPYMNKKDKVKLKKVSSKKAKGKKVKVNVAILGGGDVVFPILLIGNVFHTLGLIPAIIVAIGSTLGLTWLLYKSEKGKFYPAMPFITLGALIGLGVAYLL